MNQRQNVQYVTVVIVRDLSSDTQYMLYRSCDFENFVALRLFVDCSEIFSPGPYCQWNLMDILSLQHCVIPWKVNLGLAYFSVYIYDENRKFCLKENHVMKLSALFSCNEPKTKSSVRYRRSCLQTEIRSYLYATWHSAVLKINEVWIFDTLRFREFCSAQIICRLQ